MRGMSGEMGTNVTNVESAKRFNNSELAQSAPFSDSTFAAQSDAEELIRLILVAESEGYYAAREMFLNGATQSDYAVDVLLSTFEAVKLNNLNSLSEEVGLTQGDIPSEEYHALAAVTPLSYSNKAVLTQMGELSRRSVIVLRFVLASLEAAESQFIRLIASLLIQEQKMLERIETLLAARSIRYN